MELSRWSENKINLEQLGSTISEQNKRLGRFGLMLAHPEFQTFFEENFTTWDDTKQAIMLLKTGVLLREAIEKTTGEPVSGNQIVAALKSVMDNSETRRFMVQSLIDFISEHNANSVIATETKHEEP